MKNNRKAVDERHMKILNMIRERGEVKVEDLAKIFQISPMTVRRDMQYLEGEKGEWVYYLDSLEREKKLLPKLLYAVSGGREADLADSRGGCFAGKSEYAAFAG